METLHRHGHNTGQSAIGKQPYSTGSRQKCGMDDAQLQQPGADKMDKRHKKPYSTTYGANADGTGCARVAGGEISESE